MQMDVFTAFIFRVRSIFILVDINCFHSMVDIPLLKFFQKMQLYEYVL